MTLRIQKRESAVPKKAKTKPEVNIVHGDRTCRQCKGICHDGSYREAGFHERRGYYCSLACLKRSYRKEIKKSFKKHGLHFNDEYFETNPDYLEHERAYINGFERVDCITE